jgi:DNA-binding transcriptional LysR family regulator
VPTPSTVAAQDHCPAPCAPAPVAGPALLRRPGTNPLTASPLPQLDREKTQSESLLWFCDSRCWDGKEVSEVSSSLTAAGGCHALEEIDAGATHAGTERLLGRGTGARSQRW